MQTAVEVIRVDSKTHNMKTNVLLKHEAFRDKWVEESGNRRIKTLSTEQLLRDCEAITDDGIAYAALALFGKRESLGKYLPQAEIIKWAEVCLFASIGIALSWRARESSPMGFRWITF